MPGMSLDRVNPVIMADQGHLNDEIPANNRRSWSIPSVVPTPTQLMISMMAVAAMATRKLGMP